MFPTSQDRGNALECLKESLEEKAFFESSKRDKRGRALACVALFACGVGLGIAADIGTSKADTNSAFQASSQAFLDSSTDNTHTIYGDSASAIDALQKQLGADLGMDVSLDGFAKAAAAAISGGDIDVSGDVDLELKDFSSSIQDVVKNNMKPGIYADWEANKSDKLAYDVSEMMEKGASLDEVYGRVLSSMGGAKSMTGSEAFGFDAEASLKDGVAEAYDTYFDNVAPDYPAETHVLGKSPSGFTVHLKNPDGTAGLLDNPDGPAVVTKDGKELFFQAGERVKAYDHENNHGAMSMK